MAGSEQETQIPIATAGQGTWRNLPERFLGRILGLLGSYRRVEERHQSNSRQSNNRQANNHQYNSRSKHRPSRNGAYRIERRSNWRTQRKKLMPFLSPEHKHTRHDKCFVPHLIDAVRMYKLLDRLEDEQLESEKHALDLQTKALDASMQADALKKIQNADFNFIIQEHEECIQVSEEALQMCRSSDKVRETSMRLVQRDIRHALQGLFDTVDEYSVHCNPVPIDIGFIIALRRLKEALQRSTKAEQDHNQACAERNARKATKESTPEGQTQIDPRLAAVEAAAALQTSRRVHRKLQEQFFAENAVKTAGDRAELPHFLTAENLDKLWAQRGPLVGDQVPFEDDLPRQPHRDQDGRPTNAGISLLPPLDENLREVAAEYAETKAKFKRANERKDEVHKWVMKRHARYLVACPSANKASIIHDLTWEGKPILDAIKEIDDARERCADEYSECRHRMAAASNDVEWWEPDDPDYNPHVSDYNCSSESNTVRAARRLTAQPQFMRPWQRVVALPYLADLKHKTKLLSSAQIKPFSTGSIQLPDNTCDIEKRQQRLQAYAEILEETRSDTEERYRKYLEEKEGEQRDS